jgi:hypothetical protein
VYEINIESYCPAAKGAKLATAAFAKHFPEQSVGVTLLPSESVARLHMYRQAFNTHGLDSSNALQHSAVYNFRKPVRNAPSGQCDLCQEAPAVHYNVDGGFYRDVCDECATSMNAEVTE